MNTIEKIKAEIERLAFELDAPDAAPYNEAYKIGAKHALQSVTDFIENLEKKQQKITDDELAMLLAVIHEPANAASVSCHLALQNIYGKLTMNLKCKECNFFESERSHCALEPENYGIVFPDTDACKFFHQDTDCEIAGCVCYYQKEQEQE